MGYIQELRRCVGCRGRGRSYSACWKSAKSSDTRVVSSDTFVSLPMSFPCRCTAQVADVMAEEDQLYITRIMGAGPRNQLAGRTATLRLWPMIAPISPMRFPTWPLAQTAVRIVCESGPPGFTFGCVPPAATSAAAINPNTTTPVTTTWPIPSTSSSGAWSRAKPGGTAG